MYSMSIRDLVGENTTQKIFGLGLGATGIVDTLVIVGIFLKVINISQSLGYLAIVSGVGIGIVLGLLGILAVAKRVLG